MKHKFYLSAEEVEALISNMKSEMKPVVDRLARQYLVWLLKERKENPDVMR